MANPSPFLDEMVERYMVPGNEEFKSILREIMGEDTPGEVIRDVGCSITGQILYYAFAWPLFIRMNPGHPGMNSKIEDLAEHVTRFSIGGIHAKMKSLKEKKNIGKMTGYEGGKSHDH